AASFAPIFEEMFFRGCLFAGFSASKVRVTGAILLTAGRWALLHATQYNIWGLLVIFGLGVAFGIVRWKTNSLYASLSMHSLWNLVSTVLGVLYIQGRIH
ncbi:MAG: CPBP family intramembrane glutamic endopeptidase, partial [Dehalococcoidales bacterium]